MAKSPVKLPPLPDSAPEGSMAEYLAKARSEQGGKIYKNDQATDSTNNSTDPSFPVASSSLSSVLPLTELSSNPVLPTSHASTFPDSGENLSESRANGTPKKMSKILDKMTPPKAGNQIKKETAADGNEDQEPGTVRIRERQKESTTHQLLNLEAYLQALPQVFTSAMHLKGHVKIRLTDQTSSLLQLIATSQHEDAHLVFLAENLINELLRDFFVRYTPEIQQLCVEMDRREVERQQQKISNIRAYLKNS